MKVTTKGQGVLPKAVCERKQIEARTSTRISGGGDGLYLETVSERFKAD